MFETANSSGKHMILDIKNIINTSLLNDINSIKLMLDLICEKHDYTILYKNEHQFSPHGVTILYMLSESHISIHTFPEKNYAAMDIYTCRPYESNEVYMEIYNFIMDCFGIGEPRTPPVILDRTWDDSTPPQAAT
jgi:S-adenosylmethionine decarboxylase proenzyme